ncbi:MAG: hypothetical protein K1Y36_17245 [Blastocatellia bacterium]|nr:hypothetical protein [Blastocatellia bacterium]
MFSKPNRFLMPSDLPKHLFDPSQETLFLSSNLGESYRQILEEIGYLTLALDKGKRQDGPIGGTSKTAASEHFALRFDGSCARVQLAALDPNDHLGETSNIIIQTFAGGRVGIMDLPCGAGAATIALLTTIAELRQAAILPRVPLDIFFVGGDNSQTALDYANQLFQKLQPSLNEQAIFLHLKLEQWDLFCPNSTTKLIHTWTEHALDCRENILVVANFSGFLHSQNNFKKAEERLGEIFRWAAYRNSNVIWIEPQMKKTTTMWESLKKSKSFKTIISIFQTNPSPVNSETLQTKAQFANPLELDIRNPVHLSLVKLERNKQ